MRRRKAQTQLRITLNPFAPWVVWPLARYSSRQLETSPQAATVTDVEMFAVTVLFLSIELQSKRERAR